MAANAQLENAGRIYEFEGSAQHDVYTLLSHLQSERPKKQRVQRALHIL